MNSLEESRIVSKLIAVGERCDSIRAMLLTSSLCNPDAPSDILSDFDVELFFDDPTPFVESDDWIEELGFGPAMALWHWPNEWDYEKGDGSRWMRMVYFHDGTKMDITLAHVDELRRIASLPFLPPCYDIGYRVLLDKDGVAATMKPSTYKAYVLSPPEPDQFRIRQEAFWMNSTYVAKYLWRGDVVGARWRLIHLTDDHDLREVLEWSIAARHEWKWRPGHNGRGLKAALDPETWRQLVACYAGADPDDLWEALFQTTALFRNAATEVAAALGYAYDNGLDRKVTAYHETVRQLDKNASREDLARILAKALSAH